MYVYIYVCVYVYNFNVLLTSSLQLFEIPKPSHLLKTKLLTRINTRKAKNVHIIIPYIPEARLEGIQGSGKRTCME